MVVKNRHPRLPHRARISIVPSSMKFVMALSQVAHPIVLTETVCNPPTTRGNMTELVFEAYGAPALVFGTDVAFRYDFSNPFVTCECDAMAILFSHSVCRVACVLCIQGLVN